MKLIAPTFEKLAAVVSDIATAIEEFEASQSDYDEAEDADDRADARDCAMVALREIIAYADNNLRHLVEQIEE